MVCEPCEQGDEPIRRLAKRAREEYERLGPYEDDFVRPPVAAFPAHVLEQDPLKVEGSVLETILDERGSAASEMMSGETINDLRREIQRLKIRLTYVSVECDWYREACETWLRHGDGCAADIGDEYRCKCGLRKWLVEDKRRRETVYKEGERP